MDAVTQLLLSDHCLRVEQLRRRQPPVPRDQRRCRFCTHRLVTEDEAHILLQCYSHEPLNTLRRNYLTTLYLKYPQCRRLRLTLSDVQFIAHILQLQGLLPVTAKYLFDVLELYSTYLPS